jgi:predicted esterase
MQQRNIIVPKTARYFVLGKPGNTVTTVWFVCHGYGQLASYFIQNFAHLQNENTLIIAPEGLHRFYWEKFSGRVVASWMTKEDREIDIQDYINYLDMVYEEVMQSLNKAPVKLMMLGFSQGTSTICRWIAAKKLPVHRLLLWAGSLPADIDFSHFKSFKIYFFAGDEDEFVKQEQLEETEKQLLSNGLSYEIIRYHGKHGIDVPTLSALMHRPEMKCSS